MARIFRFGTSGAIPMLMIAFIVIVLLILIPFLALGLAGAAFAKLGFSWPEAVAVIALMVIGYFINIPVGTIRNTRMSDTNIGSTIFDAFTGEPVNTGRSSTTIFLNLGGAILPIVVSGYLVYESPRVSVVSLLLPLAVCLAVVALVVAFFTRAFPEQRISAPLIFPALAAVACAILLNGGTGLESAITAFTGGTLGILLGAGLMALHRGIRDGIPQISIGGAGMFGPVLFCAVLSALIA